MGFVMVCLVCEANSYLARFKDIEFMSNRWWYVYTNSGSCLSRKGVRKPLKIYFRQCKECQSAIPYRVVGGWDRLRKLSA